MNHPAIEQIAQSKKLPVFIGVTNLAGFPGTITVGISAKCKEEDFLQVSRTLNSELVLLCEREHIEVRFPHINFALLIGQIYMFFRVLNDAFPRGKKSGLMHVVAQGGWGKTDSVLPKKGSEIRETHGNNVHESKITRQTRLA